MEEKRVSVLKKIRERWQRLTSPTRPLTPSMPTRASLLSSLPVNPLDDRTCLPAQFREAITQRDARRIEELMLTAETLELHADCTAMYCELMDLDWHYQHEDLAHVLQSLRDPRAVDSLYRAALSNFPYRAYDDYGMLADQCMYALRAIGTPAALDAIQRLTEATDPVIAERADWHSSQGLL